MALFRILEGGGDHHALAGGKPVRLHDDRHAVIAHIGLGRLRIGEAAVGGGGNAELGAEILGEGLRAFELRGGLARSEGLDAGRRQIVDEAGDEGRFRPDHDEIDLHHPAEIDHRSMIRHVEHHIGAVLRGAGIAGSDEKLVAERARREAAGQSMFPSAGPDEKNVHGKASLMTPALLTIPAPFAYPEIAWPRLSRAGAAKCIGDSLPL